MENPKTQTKAKPKVVDEHLDWILAIDFINCVPH